MNPAIEFLCHRNITLSLEEDKSSREIQMNLQGNKLKIHKAINYEIVWGVLTGS